MARLMSLLKHEKKGADHASPTIIIMLLCVKRKFFNNNLLHERVDDKKNLAIPSSLEGCIGFFKSFERTFGCSCENHW